MFALELLDFGVQVLGLETGAPERDIKRAYRRMSLEYHPDKRGGDDDVFIKISKAYEALTDPVARENYEKFGNPDGRQVLEVGIGLPQFLEDSGNYGVVIAGYIALLAVVFPLIACRWFGQEDTSLLKMISGESMRWFDFRIAEDMKLQCVIPFIFLVKLYTSMVNGCPLCAVVVVFPLPRQEFARGVCRSRRVELLEPERGGCADGGDDRVAAWSPCAG